MTLARSVVIDSGTDGAALSDCAGLMGFVVLIAAGGFSGIRCPIP